MVSDNQSESFSFKFHDEEELKVSLVIATLILIWGVAYMNIINNRLFFFFNETVFNSLMGIFLGLFVSSSTSIRLVVKVFLPWENFENNILPFMLIYPASKLCAQAARKQYRMNFTYAILSGFFSVMLDTCLFSVVLLNSATSYYYTTDGQPPSRFYCIMLAVYISASVSIYDTYLCVHNFPEIRGNSAIRSSLSSYGLTAMLLALELRDISLLLTMADNPTAINITIIILKRIVYIPLVSILMGITFGLISSFITKHSSFLHMSQEMVVLPCSNYIAYTVAQKAGLSSILSSVTCEVVQGTYSVRNVSEASKITYRALLAKSSKLLGFFCTLSLGFQFGADERNKIWNLISIQMFGTFLGITIIVRIFSALLGYWCVQRLGFQMRSCLLFLNVLTHTRATPSLISLVNLQIYSVVFRVCPASMQAIQWTLFIMCNFVNLINVPIVGIFYRRLKIEPDIVDNRAEPLFLVIFKLMYHEMHQQIVHLAGERRSYQSVSLALRHISKNFIRYVMSLGFMSVPERKSPIISTYNQTVSTRSNVIDRRRKSLRSKNRIFATQVCASFIVRNLSFEGFHADDIAEYFWGQ